MSMFDKLTALDFQTRYASLEEVVAEFEGDTRTRLNRLRDALPGRKREKQQ